MKLGGKGGKGKRRQKNNSLSSSMEVVKEGECQDDALTFSVLIVCKKNGIMMIRNHSSIFSVSINVTRLIVASFCKFENCLSLTKLLTKKCSQIA